MAKRVANVVSLGDQWWASPRKPGEEVDIKRRRKISDRYHPIKWFAERFEVSVDLIYEEIHRGKLKADLLGRVYRISEEDFIDYLGRETRRGAK